MSNYQSALKSLVSVLIGVLFAHASNGQTVGIPDTNAIWRINDVGWGFSSPQNPFGITGDTLIGSISYKKIVQSVDTSSNFANFQYFCAARNDMGKWFFIPENDSIEYLLYDFSAGVGDTVIIENPWTTGIPEPVKVDSIKTINLFGSVRTHLFVSDLNNNWYPEIWIDGIGSDHGLFYTAEYYFDLSHQLICFHEDDSLKYLNSPNGECYYSNLSTINYHSEEIVVYPNPAFNVVNFQLPKELNPMSIILLSIDGTVVYEGVFQEQLILNKESIVVGLYFYNIVLANERIVKGKILIQ